MREKCSFAFVILCSEQNSIDTHVVCISHHLKVITTDLELALSSEEHWRVVHRRQLLDFI